MPWRKEELKKAIVTRRRMRRAVMIQSSSRSGWRSSEVVPVARIGLDLQQLDISNVERAVCDYLTRDISLHQVTRRIE